MKIVLNEQEIISEALSSKHVDDNNSFLVLRVLTKHYFSIGMDTQQVRSSLHEFFQCNLKNYNPVIWKDRINNSISAIKKYGSSIVNVKQVNITLNELNTIHSLCNNELEKIAFVYLVYSKIYNQINKADKYWVSAKIKDILDDSMITKGYKSIKDQQKPLRELNKLGLLQHSFSVDNTNDKVCFADEDSEVVIVITDFRNFVLEYLRWRGENIGNCEECGTWIHINKNVKKYCSPCAKEVKNNQNKTYYKVKNRFLGK